MSEFRFTRKYVGPVKAAIFDWGGTVADKYVMSPAVAFVDVFKKHNVDITMAESRGPMGIRKDLHIAALTQMPEIRQRWHKVHGRYPDQGDVDKMFAEYTPIQLKCLRDYTTLVPGCVESMATLRSEYKLKIGTTTGFLKAMMDILIEDAAKQGFVPDANVAGDDISNGARPRPFMIFQNMNILDVYPVQAVVKVDDTVPGITAAQNAGCWGVGVARYSNYMNINSLEEEAALSEEEIATRLTKSRDILFKSGAHYVIDTLDEMPQVIADINQRLARGEQP